MGTRKPSIKATYVPDGRPDRDSFEIDAIVLQLFCMKNRKALVAATGCALFRHFLPDFRRQLSLACASG
jgi:hypothetical protein